MGFSTKILLLLKHGPCTSDEIQEQLGVSQSVVSRELRELIEDKYVKKYNSNTPLYYKNNESRKNYYLIRCKYDYLKKRAKEFNDIKDKTLSLFGSNTYNQEELKEEINVKDSKKFKTVLRILQDYGIKCSKGPNGYYWFSPNFEKQAVLRSSSKHSERIYKYLESNSASFVKEMSENLSIDTTILLSVLKKLEKYSLVKKAGNYPKTPYVFYLKNEDEWVAVLKSENIYDAYMELKQSPILSKNSLKKTYGINVVKKLKKYENIGVTNDYVFNIETLLETPKSIKELCKIFNFGRGQVTYNLKKFEEANLVKSSWKNGQEKIYYLATEEFDLEELLLGSAERKVFSFLKKGPFQREEMQELLEMNKNTLSSKLYSLKKKGLIEAVNAVGRTSNLYYYFVKKDEMSKKLAYALALGLEDIFRILNSSPSDIKGLMEQTGLLKETLLHKIRRLLDNDVIKVYQTGRNFIYYLDNSQKFKAKIESLGSRQRFIYEHLCRKDLTVTEIRQLCGFEKDENYRVRNHIKLLKEAGLVDDNDKKIKSKKPNIVRSESVIGRKFQEELDKLEFIKSEPERRKKEIIKQMLFKKYQLLKRKPELEKV